jgi:hypothetical protein
MAPTGLWAMRREPRQLPQGQRPAAWQHSSGARRSQAEAMLREMAFVYQATRSIRESMMEEAIRVV